jgi:hypothetical protein
MERKQAKRPHFARFSEAKRGGFPYTCTGWLVYTLPALGNSSKSAGPVLFVSPFSFFPFIEQNPDNLLPV